MALRRSTAVVLLALITATTTACLPPARPIHQVPSSIDASGAQDVTTALAAFFATVPDGATIRFLSGSRYRSEGTLLFDRRHDLVLDGNGAQIFATTTGPATRRNLTFTLGSDIVVRDLVVRGAHPSGGIGVEAYVPALEHQHGFEFRGTEGVELDRVRVSDVHGDLVYLGRYRDTTLDRWTSGVRIHDSTFERNGRQGIAITAARDVVIERNTIREVAMTTFDVEPNSPAGWGAEDVVIRSNTIGRSRFLTLAVVGSGPVARIEFVGNQMVGDSLDLQVSAPLGQRRSTIRVADNTSDTTMVDGSGFALRFSRVDGLTVTGNHQPVGPAMTGIGIDESCAVMVADNQFPGAVSTSRIGAWDCPPPPA